MKRSIHPLVIASGLALLAGLATSTLGAPDEPADAATPNTAPTAVAAKTPTPPPTFSTPAAQPEPPSELRDAIEGFLGAPVSGWLRTEYRWRRSGNGTDQDAYQLLNLRVGDESKDRVSANVFVRAAEDLDHAHQNDSAFDFRSIDDKYDRSVQTWLYTAYATLRPEASAFETLRIGRQYVYAAETFHLDGVSATTRPLVDSIGLRLTGYGGAPVHFYESSSRGDWLAGVRAEADPWEGGRAALDYAHVKDRLSLLGPDERNDLAAVAVWQQVATNVDLHGAFQWLDGPRDGTLRATAAFPESDLLVQASYYRLLETKDRFATEFDPYSRVILNETRYEQGTLLATLGLGDGIDIEVGGSARRLLDGEDETRFNRDVHRVYVTPSITDVPWEGSTLSVTGESYTGAGERLRTWGVDLTHRFDKRTRVSVGSDYTLYGFGRFATQERLHVRTAYLRGRFPLSDALSADVRYTWERDDVETFQVLTLALVLDF